MANIVTAEANRLLDASLGTDSYEAPTTPMMLALATSASSASAPGTEVTGGGYERQEIAFTAASNGTVSNTETISFTNMPAATVTHIDIYDSSETPRRCWFGALTTSKTVGDGDTISFNAGAITISLS